MKLRFLSSIMLCSLVVCARALAHDSEHNQPQNVEHSQIESSYTSIECTIIPKNQSESNFSHPHIPGPRTKSVPAGQVASTNWSGYAAETNFNHPKKNSVSAVSASWIVPTVIASGGDTFSSIWVGIDGYSTSTVEQIGTELTVPTSFTQSSSALRESAEWIVEAPFFNGILPLSDFVTVYMWGCMATINGSTGPIGNHSWQNVGIEMVTNDGTPKDLTSSLLPDKGSFFVRWQHQ